MKPWVQRGDASTRIFIEQTLQTMVALLDCGALTKFQRGIVKRDIKRLTNQYLSEINDALEDGVDTL